MARDIMVVPFEVKEINVSDPDYVILTGYASVYNNVDRGNDRVIQGAFTDTLKENNNQTPGLFCHDMKQPIGMHYYQDTMNGLLITAKYPKADDFVRGRVLPQIEVGSLKSFSIGYNVKECYYSTESGKQIRNLKKLDLMESSLLPVPMNPKAQVFSVTKAAANILEYKGMGEEAAGFISELAKGISSKEIELKTMDENVEWNKDKSEADIKEHNGSKECYIGDYPIVYWIEKEYKIVPKAVYIACAQNIESKESETKGIINSYYKKLGREIPFKDDGSVFIDIDILHAFNKKQFSKLLETKNYTLSNKCKDFIMDSFKGTDPSSGSENNEILDYIRQANLMLDLKMIQLKS